MISSTPPNTIKLDSSRPIVCTKCGNSTHMPFECQSGGMDGSTGHTNAPRVFHRSYRVVTTAPMDNNIQRMASQLNGRSLWRSLISGRAAGHCEQQCHQQNEIKSPARIAAARAVRPLRYRGSVIDRVLAIPIFSFSVPACGSRFIR